MDIALYILLLSVGGLVGALSMIAFPKNKEPEIAKITNPPVDTSHEAIKELRREYEAYVRSNSKIDNSKLLDTVEMIDKQQELLSAQFKHVCEDMRNQMFDFKKEIQQEFWVEMKANHAAEKKRNEKILELQEKIAELSPYHRHLHLDKAKENKQFQAQAEHVGIPTV